MDHIALFNFIYLIIYFYGEETFNNPFTKHHTVDGKSYRRKSGSRMGRWTETEITKGWDGGCHDTDSVSDYELLNKLHNYENYTIFRLNNRSQYILMLLAFINICFFMASFN